ncbi:hypothetical protein Dcar01_03731 [Deinococcus carri]|uniref:Uncharacterized protein n=1 Tax=Deinococcus carri TaxID=1211323 RepID=A0ABP9WCA6_9DEIO
MLKFERPSPTNPRPEPQHESPPARRLHPPGAASPQGDPAANPEAQRAAQLNRSTPRAAVQAQVRLNPQRSVRPAAPPPVQAPTRQMEARKRPVRGPLPQMHAVPPRVPAVKATARQSGAGRSSVRTALQVAAPRRLSLQRPTTPSTKVMPAAFAKPRLDPLKLKAARLNPRQVLRDAEKRRTQANKLVGGFLKRGSAQAGRLQTLSGKLGAQVRAAAQGARSRVQASARRHKAALRANIAAMRTQAGTQAAVAHGQLQARATAALAALPKSTQAARTRLKADHTRALRQVDTRTRAQKSGVTAAYQQGAARYRAGGVTVGGEALAHAEARASAYLANVTGKDDSFWDGPLTDDRWKARADAARQVGRAYQQGYAEQGNEQAAQLLAPDGGLGRDLAAIEATARQTRAGLQARLQTAQRKLGDDEARTRRQIQQAQAQLNQALQTQLQGVLAGLGQTQGTQLAAIAHAAAQQTQALDGQADQAVRGLQRSVTQVARQLDRTLNRFGTQVRSSQAPDPRALRRALAGAEAQIGRMVTGAQAQLRGGVGHVTAGLARGAAQAEGSLGAAARSGAAQASQSAQGFRQSSQALVGQALQTFAQLQQAHGRSSAATAAQAHAEFEAAHQHLSTLFEQARTGLEGKLAASAGALIEQLRASFSQLDAAINAQAEKAAAQVQPRWKGWVKIALVVAVVIVVAVLAGPLVIGAVGALAGALGAGATAAGVIGTVVGGAIVGAAAGAVTQIGNNAIDNIGVAAGNQKSLFDGIGKAALIGAVGGAIGGAGGAIGQGLGRAGLLGEGLTQKVAGFGVSSAFDLGGNVMGDLATGSSLSDALKNLTSPEAIMMYAIASGTGAAASRLPGRVGAVQNTMHAAGERFGTTAGDHINNVSGNRRGVMPTGVDSTLAKNTTRISGYRQGRTRVDMSPSSHPQDVQIHQRYAVEARADTSLPGGLKNRVQRLLNSETTQVGGRRWELELEARKHADMATWREQQARDLPKTDPKAQRLVAEARELRLQEADYLNRSRNAPQDGATGQIEHADFPHLTTDEYNAFRARIDAASPTEVWRVRYERYQLNKTKGGLSAEDFDSWLPKAQELHLHNDGEALPAERI